MTTLEITNMMFGKKIHFFSFFIAVAITFAFSALVNIIMHHSLKKIWLLSTPTAMKIVNVLQPAEVQHVMYFFPGRRFSW